MVLRSDAVERAKLNLKGLAILLAVALFAAPGEALGEEVPAEPAMVTVPSTGGVASLAPPVQLRLTLPVMPTRLRSETPLPFLVPYWMRTPIAATWRDARDHELRLELKSFEVRSGSLGLSTAVVTVPERERLCYPHCKGLGWGSRLRLQWHTGQAMARGAAVASPRLSLERKPVPAMSPAITVRPTVEVGVSPAASKKSRRSLFRLGLDGTF